MENNTLTHNYSFLSGGGEMGALIRAFDWSQTPVGPIDTWPQSLRTTVGMILTSRFPMFLWWGPDLIQFYNDAYRPSLGNDGKHPTALGQRGEDCWPEVWPTIKPLFDQVLTEGESTWSENQLVPIHRNGHLENVYWTFGYSPIRNETGQIAGVLAVCQETTKTVIESAEMRFAIESAEAGTWILDPVQRSVYWDARCRELFGARQGDEIRYDNLLTYIHPDDRHRVDESVRYALTPESGGRYYNEYRVVGPDNAQLRWLRCKGRAYFDEHGIAYRLSGISQDITEEKRKDAALRQVEQRFQMAFNNAALGICITDKNGRFLLINQAYAQMTGYSAEELYEMDYRNLTHSDDLINNQVLMAQLSRGEIPFFNLDKRYIRKDGSVFWVRINVTRLANEQGETDSTIAICQDITQEVADQQKLKDSEQRFRSLIQAAPVAIGLFIGRDLIIENPNQTFIDIVGKGDWIIGKPLREAMPELHNQPFLQILDDVFTTGVPYQTFDTPVDIVRNEVMHHGFYDINYIPLFDAQGQVYAILDIATEVTEQVKARQQIEASERRFRQLIADAPVATTLFVGRDLIIEYPNERMLTLWGKGDSVVGMPLAKALPELEGQPFLQILDNVFTSGVPYHASADRCDLVVDGQLQTFYFNFTYEPLRNENGQVYAILDMAIDVTEQVKARQELEISEARYRQLTEELDERVRQRTLELSEINRDLERSNKNLEQFAYVASHDLQEPLRKIQSFGDILKNQYAAELGDGMGHLERMQAAANRMSVLIKDLLTFSRISTRQESTAPVSLGLVVTRALDDLSVAIQETGARIEMNSLPIVKGDESQLGQLFLNLLSNALKFRKPDMPPHVRISAQRIQAADLPAFVKPTRQAETYVCISVSDNGIGFDTKYMDRIFQVFQRLHGKNEFSGTGVGLAICEKVAGNHGGAITARSKPGRGATFYVYLPM